MKPAVVVPPSKAPMARPTATATIEPLGRRSDAVREHMVKLVVELASTDPRFADKDTARATAQRALGAYSPDGGAQDPRHFRDLTVTVRGKGGVPTSAVVAVEGSVVCPGHPAETAMETIRATLHEGGYKVIMRERRECAETACPNDVMIEWKRPDDIPSGWFTNQICGRHDYRRCPKCKSVHQLTPTNAAGQAPAVHCQVCGTVIVEWGSSKVWVAQLVTRVELVS